MDARHLKAIFGDRVLLGDTIIPELCGSQREFRIVDCVTPPVHASGSGHASASAQEAPAEADAPQADAESKKAVAKGHGPTAKAAAAEPVASAEPTSEQLRTGPGPWFRAIPTVPGFYQSCARADGYRVITVLPAHKRAQTPNLIKPDGTFSEGGTHGDAAATTCAAPAARSGDVQSGASPWGDGSGSDLRDLSLYSKFDGEDFPTHDKNGEELTKSQYKKVRKLIEQERKKQAKKK